MNGGTNGASAGTGCGIWAAVAAVLLAFGVLVCMLAMNTALVYQAITDDSTHVPYVPPTRYRGDPSDRDPCDGAGRYTVCD